jgi:3-oxoacyl-[acyl-carrier-protein] synthase-1
MRTLRWKTPLPQAGLTPEQVSHPRTGLIMGSGGGSPANQIEAADTLRSKGIRRVGPYQVTRCMSSTVSACLSTNFGQGHQLLHHLGLQHLGALHWRGSPADRLGHAGRDVCRRRRRAVWGMGLLFDGMGAMSSKPTTTRPRKPRAPTTPTATAS